MINLCVLDTTIASFLVNKNPIIAPYIPHLIGATPILCFQTAGEMRYGALKSHWGQKRKQILEHFLQDTEIIHSDDNLTQIWADLMHQSHRIGRRLEAGDCWIAAAAMRLNAPLLTHDKDFDMKAFPSITVVCYAQQSPAI